MLPYLSIPTFCAKSVGFILLYCRIIKRRSQTKWKWLNVHIKPLLPTDSSFDHFSKVPKLGLFTFTQLSKGYYIRLMWNDEREDPNLVSDIFLRKVTKVHVTYKNTNIIESLNSLPFCEGFHFTKESVINR